MIDQSHNLKGKVEAMVQTVVTAQELYAKTALVDRAKLAEFAAGVPAGGGGGMLPKQLLAGCAAGGDGVEGGARVAGRAFEGAGGERVCGEDLRVSEGAGNANSVSSYA